MSSHTETLAKQFFQKLFEVRKELEGYNQELHGEDYGSPSLNALINQGATMFGMNYMFAVKKSLFDEAVAAGKVKADDPRCAPMMDIPPPPEADRLIVITLFAYGRVQAEHLFFVEFDMPFEDVLEQLP